MAMPPAIECIAFRPGWEADLARFFSDLRYAGDDAIFHPHPGDEASLRSLAMATGDDLHYLFVRGRDVVAYGLLRGWNAGYSVPSLGIAVHPAERAMGFGRLMMDWLEAMARQRNAPSVRLRVHKDNARARAMYERRGYRMAADEEDLRLLVGLKSLESHSP